MWPRVDFYFSSKSDAIGFKGHLNVGFPFVAAVFAFFKPSKSESKVFFFVRQRVHFQKGRFVKNVSPYFETPSPLR